MLDVTPIRENVAEERFRVSVRSLEFLHALHEEFHQQIRVNARAHTIFQQTKHGAHSRAGSIFSASLRASIVYEMPARFPGFYYIVRKSVARVKSPCNFEPDLRCLGKCFMTPTNVSNHEFTSLGQRCRAAKSPPVGVNSAKIKLHGQPAIRPPWPRPPYRGRRRRRWAGRGRRRSAR